MIATNAGICGERMSDRPLTRADFIEYEDWLRHCHEGGILPDQDDKDFSGISGRGYYANLMGAIHGHDRRSYRRAWAGHGWSELISPEQYRKAYQAIGLANCLGKVLDTSIDISWSTVHVTSDLTVAAHQKRFFDLVHRWLERNGEVPMLLWVLERGKKMGLHTHALTYLPRHLRKSFREFASRSLAGVVGRRLVPKPTATLLIQPRDGRSWKSQWVRYRYMMKGTKPRHGVVATKRLGVSRALDQRALADWLTRNQPPPALIEPAAALRMDDCFISYHREMENEDARKEWNARNGIVQEKTENPFSINW